MFLKSLDHLACAHTLIQGFKSQLETACLTQSTMQCCRPDNYLLLDHVLKRVGLTQEQFLAAHKDEVVVHEVNERLLQTHVSSPLSKSNNSSNNEGRRVELVRMCDIVRRLLNIEVVAVSGQHSLMANF